MKSKTFEAESHSDFVKDQLQLAIKDWGITGVEFTYVNESEIDNASFIVKYSKTPVDESTVAEAFTPVKEQSRLVIYPNAFSEGQIKYMRNNLAHEVGHIYGLKHEFAIKEPGAQFVVQFGPSNPLSVMNYNSPPVIQESDRMFLQKLYDENQSIPNVGGSNNYPVRRIYPFSNS